MEAIGLMPERTVKAPAPAALRPLTDARPALLPVSETGSAAMESSC